MWIAYWDKDNDMLLVAVRRGTAGTAWWWETTPVHAIDDMYASLIPVTGDTGMVFYRNSTKGIDGQRCVHVLVTLPGFC